VASAAPAAHVPAAHRWSGFDDWEPTVAADPGSSLLYQMTTRYPRGAYCGGRLNHCIVLRASADGGRHWGPDRVMPHVAAIKFQNDPELAVARDGTLYAAWMNDYNVMFARSRDHGRTWSRPVNMRRLSGLDFNDKPMIAISPSGRDVYVAFNASDSYVASSHDHGRTFSVSARTNADGRYWFAEQGAVAPDGTVLFAESAELQSGLGSVHLAVIRSTDGGATWHTTIVGRSAERPPCPTAGCPADFYGPQTAIAVHRSGQALAVYGASAVADGPTHLFARRSRDAGATWGPPALVTAAGSAVGADFQQLAVGRRAGDFRLVFMDDRRGPRAWNVWLMRLRANGWTRAVRLSTNRPTAPYQSRAGFVAPYGDYLGVAVDRRGATHAIWGEGPSYNGPGGTWFTSG
jgi:hypothetical protein